VALNNITLTLLFEIRRIYRIHFKLVKIYGSTPFLKA
jgi:hypothetical protein